MRSLTFDAAKRKEKTLKGKFKPSSTAERKFYKALKKVAQASGHIVEQHIDGSTIIDERKMQAELKRYSEALGPWAERQSAKLLNQVQNSNKSAYTKKSKVLGRLLDNTVSDREVGEIARKLLNEQVGLIKSIPVEAGLRAQRIAYEAAMTGTRAAPDDDTVAELERELGLSTEVAISRAKLIAVTETARANASINQARAMSVGSGRYRWHNSGDEAVRDSHEKYRGEPSKGYSKGKLQGKIFRWDDPPVLDDGTKGHPGTFPRCRCFAEPVFDDE